MSLAVELDTPQQLERRGDGRLANQRQIASEDRIAPGRAAQAPREAGRR